MLIEAVDGVGLIPSRNAAKVIIDSQQILVTVTVDVKACQNPVEHSCVRSLRRVNEVTGRTTGTRTLGCYCDSLGSRMKREGMNIFSVASIYDCLGNPFNLWLGLWLLEIQ